MSYFRFIAVGVGLAATACGTPLTVESLTELNSTAPARAAAKGGCVAQADGFYQDGQLWRAQRLLATCPASPDGAQLAASVAAELGQEQSTNVEGILGHLFRSHARSPEGAGAALEGELALVWQALAERNCSQADERARTAIEHWNPNPVAWLLLARAAECRKEAAHAHRFRSRAADG